MFVGCKFSIIKKLILINLGLIIALVLLTFLFGQRWGTVLFRIKNFINPSEIPYQLEQSYIAIANGQMFGIGIGKSWDDFKALGLKAVIVTMLVIASTYLGSAVVAHVILLLTGVPA